MDRTPSRGVRARYLTTRLSHVLVSLDKLANTKCICQCQIVMDSVSMCKSSLVRICGSYVRGPAPKILRVEDFGRPTSMGF